MADFSISEDYKEVSERIRDLYAKHPNAVLRGSWTIEAFGSLAYIVYTAECVREPGEEPCVGTAMEQIPGKTPYTKGSEIQNAETSAWGRAIVAAGASESKRIASADDIRTSQERQIADAADAVPAPKEHIDGFTNAMKGITDVPRRRKIMDAFVTKFGPPKNLTMGQLQPATDWILEQIPELTKTPDPAATDDGAQPSDAPPEETPPERPSATGGTSGSSGSDVGGDGAVVGSSAPTPPTSTPAKPSTPQQRQTLGIRFKELEQAGKLPEGAVKELVGALTGGRTTTRTQLTFEEAVKLVALSHALENGTVTFEQGVGLRAANSIGEKFLETWPTPGGAQ